MGYCGDDAVYSVAGNWDPTEHCFEVLNTETPRGNIIINPYVEGQISKLFGTLPKLFKLF